MLYEPVEVYDVFEFGDSSGEASVGPIDHRDVVPGHRLTNTVTDLTLDGESLLEVGEGPLTVPQPVIHEPEVVQRGRFTPAVTDLPADGEGLLVVADRTVGVTQHLTRSGCPVQRARTDLGCGEDRYRIWR